MIKNLLLCTSLSLFSLSLSAADTGSVPEDNAGARVPAALHEAFSHYLSAWTGRHAPAENIAEIFASDAVIEVTIPGRFEWALHVNGRSAIGRFIQAGLQAATTWSFTDLRMFPTSRDDVAFAQYASTIVVDGAPIRQTNLVVIEFDGSRISRLQDLNGSPAVVAALTWPHRLATRITDDAPGQ